MCMHCITSVSTCVTCHSVVLVAACWNSVTAGVAELRLRTRERLVRPADRLAEKGHVALMRACVVEGRDRLSARYH